MLSRIRRIGYSTNAVIAQIAQCKGWFNCEALASQLNWRAEMRGPLLTIVKTLSYRFVAYLTYTGWMPAYVSYLRDATIGSINVATQRLHISAVLRPPKWVCREEFTESIEGARRGRPELRKAFAACRRLNTILAVARLDHEMRHDDFIPKLRGARIGFIVCDVRDEDLMRETDPPPRTEDKRSAPGGNSSSGG
jgi:hypothetical protein